MMRRSIETNNFLRSSAKSSHTVQTRKETTKSTIRKRKNRQGFRNSLRNKGKERTPRLLLRFFWGPALVLYSFIRFLTCPSGSDQMAGSRPGQGRLRVSDSSLRLPMPKLGCVLFKLRLWPVEPGRVWQTGIKPRNEARVTGRRSGPLSPRKRQRAGSK
ncbi:hypothetical protein H6P81_020269 [Aristolochia fimbriata]|uniref:Uncharacterized protein n=1 Tax=Aristolochia fimbriata TaxID=158543 RepID=A0AAV7DU96_ARIFI|nr:hypothetical protein H6P81_020269 [Aristolochia fimbriata]